MDFEQPVDVLSLESLAVRIPQAYTYETTASFDSSRVYKTPPTTFNSSLSYSMKLKATSTLRARQCPPPSPPPSAPPLDLLLPPNDQLQGEFLTPAYPFIERQIHANGHASSSSDDGVSDEPNKSRYRNRTIFPPAISSAFSFWEDNDLASSLREISQLFLARLVCVLVVAFPLIFAFSVAYLLIDQQKISRVAELSHEMDDSQNVFFRLFLSLFEAIDGPQQRLQATEIPKRDLRFHPPYEDHDQHKHKKRRDDPKPQHQRQDKAARTVTCEDLYLEFSIKRILDDRAGGFECGEPLSKEISEDDLLAELQSIYEEEWKDVYMPFIKACFVDAVEGLLKDGAIESVNPGFALYRRALFSREPAVSWGCNLRLKAQRNFHVIVLFFCAVALGVYLWKRVQSRKEIETAFEAEKLAKRIRERLIEQYLRIRGKNRADERLHDSDDDDRLGYPVHHLRDYARAVWHSSNTANLGKNFDLLWRKVERSITNDSRVLETVDETGAAFGRRWKWIASARLEHMGLS